MNREMVKAARSEIYRALAVDSALDIVPYLMMRTAEEKQAEFDADALRAGKVFDSLSDELNKIPL